MRCSQFPFVVASSGRLTLQAAFRAGHGAAGGDPKVCVLRNGRPTQAMVHLASNQTSPSIDVEKGDIIAITTNVDHESVAAFVEIDDDAFTAAFEDGKEW